MHPFAALTLIFIAVFQGGETVRWNRMSCDFGDLPGDTTVTAEFVCYNKGNTDLQIENISLPCRCTATESFESMIAPDDSAIIRIRYSTSGRKGKEEKYIGVYTGRGMYELVIRAHIRS